MGGTGRLCAGQTCERNSRQGEVKGITAQPFRLSPFQSGPLHARLSILKYRTGWGTIFLANYTGLGRRALSPLQGIL